MPASFPRRRPVSGFTLIEIMISVAILALISSLAFPWYQSMIEESRISTAIKEIRQMELILNDRYLSGDPPASLAEVGLDTMRDPWGQPYEYLWLRGNPDGSVNGKRRRDKSMNPVNSDYDLYSRCMDGETAEQFTAAKARDDVVRANDGDFVGLAGDH